eukprot:m.434143 g.434143  ORF g.434143 m.434143 type:complete len:337 (+) comp17666_c0_seq1:173-1183(+)
MRRGVGELKSQPGRFHGELCDVLRAVDGDEPLSPLSGPPVNLASQFKSPTKGSPIKTGESSPAKRPLPPLPPGAERTTSPEHISTPMYAALPRPHAIRPGPRRWSGDSGHGAGPHEYDTLFPTFPRSNGSAQAVTPESQPAQEQLWDVDDAEVWQILGDFARARRWEDRDLSLEPTTDRSPSGSPPRRWSDSDCKPLQTRSGFSVYDEGPDAGYSRVRASILSERESTATEGTYGLPSTHVYDNVICRRRETMASELGITFTELSTPRGETENSDTSTLHSRRASEGDKDALYTRVKSRRSRDHATSKSCPTLPVKRPSSARIRSDPHVGTPKFIA